jgi:undecaprenyl-diphosphatase
LYDFRNSATLLLVTTLGGLLLNNVLKLGFDRPRPQFFEWGTHVMSSSFPSGHAMSAAIVYPTVAYLAARLQKTVLARVVTLFLAGLLVFLICLSRVYLGVHYPSDVIAGVVVGLAWSAFCMTTLEIVQLYAKRNAPAMVEGENPPEARPVVSPGA